MSKVYMTVIRNTLILFVIIFLTEYFLIGSGLEKSLLKGSLWIFFFSLVNYFIVTKYRSKKKVEEED